MKLRLLLCTVVLALVAMPAFADTINFTNSGGLSKGMGSISANSQINTISLDGQLIFGPGNVGNLIFDTGSIMGSLKAGSFSGALFKFSFEGAPYITLNNFAGTISLIKNGIYDLVGTFSGIADGLAFTGTTDQKFCLGKDDDGKECFTNLNGSTTITTAAVPEPSTLTFFGTGLIGLAGLVRRKLAARV